MESLKNDNFDRNRSRNRLFFPDRGGVAAEREEWRSGCGFWRSGQPDRIRSARSGLGSFARNNLVSDHLYAHVHHPFDFCSTENRTNVGTFWSEGAADQVAARNPSPVRAANRSTKSGAAPEVTIPMLVW